MAAPGVMMSNRQSGYALKRKQSEMAVSAADERTIGTRKLIIKAARQTLLKNGYAATRVEDIINRAGISRPTFYRYFKDKFEVAKAYHAQSRDETMGPWAAIADIDVRDIAAIREWLENLLEAYSKKRDELVVWVEMSSVEPDYLLRMPRQMPDVIRKLAEHVPAFARAYAQAPIGELGGGDADPGPIWVEAYLLLEHITYHCTWLSLGKHMISRRQTIDYFAERLFRFIARYDGDPARRGNEAV